MAKYLPSKKFIIILSAGIVMVLAVVFIGKWKTAQIEKYQAGSTQTLADIQNITLGTLSEKDTNQNGIPDWEEALWGLNPAGDGAKNKAFIDAKKSALAQNNPSANTSSGGSDQPNDTGAFSREFFTAVASLKASGSLDQTSISELANNLSKNVTANRDIPPAHAIDEIKTTTDASPASIKKYHDAVLQAIANSKNNRLGTELAIVQNGLSGTDTNMYAELTVIAQNYKDFSDQLLKITAPKDAAQMHLDAVNAASAMAVVVANMSQVLSNPLVGMLGAAQYDQNSTALTTAFTNLGHYFGESGILKIQ